MPYMWVPVFWKEQKTVRDYFSPGAKLYQPLVKFFIYTILTYITNFSKEICTGNVRLVIKSSLYEIVDFLNEMKYNIYNERKFKILQNKKKEREVCEVKKERERGGDNVKTLNLKEIEIVLGLSRYRLRTLCSNGYYKTAQKNFRDMWIVSELEILEDKKKRESKRDESRKRNKYYIRPSTRAVRMIRRAVDNDSNLTKEEKKKFNLALNRYDKLFDREYESRK